MENKTLTLGSLFDGSGGFPLGGILAGIKPLWNSEIEPFPVLVTHKRMPQVKHYGDVSTLSGAELEPVDIITFGSPCQDMSIAGKRAGLDGARSGLFHQAIRIIKEMREATDGKYPRYCVWENVPGAFSSNGGEDFRAVLEAVIGVKEEGIEVPAPSDHRWPKADVYLGDGWSVAYRVLDAQYWGVPQRRARIYLVGDFTGGSAGEVLFKSEGLSRYSAQSLRAWQGTAGSTEEGAGKAGGRPDAGGRVLCVNTQGNSGVGITEDKTLALVAQDHGNHPSVVQAAGFSTEHSAQSRSIGYEEEVSPTLRAGVVPAAMAIDNHPTDSRVKIAEDGKVQTLTERMGTGGGNVPLVAEPEPITMKIRGGREGGGKGILCQVDKSATLGCNNDQTLFQPDIKAFGVCSKASHAMMSDNPHSGFYEAETSRTLDCNGGRPDCSQGGICVVAPAPETYDVRFTSEGTKNARGHCYKTDISRCLDTGGENPDSNHGGVAVVEPAYALQGSMIGREDKNGPQGDGINEEVSFTLTNADRHCVAAPTYCATTGSYMEVTEEKSSTLMARDYKDPKIVNDTPNDEPMYIVRRLTPVECARLQGFPDWWCADLAIPDPSEEELSFWAEVWETWRKATNPDGKPKTEKQIRKWLADPYTDAAEYKLWGNGCCAQNT
ncbi:MAG: DNA cytosine methyltransferase, partial [Clostridia bacterium]|nr:DNA cytosine methyltransferase [Clostridia bacterium]